MPPSAPSSRARASFESLLEVTIARAPKSFANCSANNATPPVPRTTTVSPSRTRAPSATPFHAVGRRAAERTLHLPGRRLTVDPLRIEDRRDAVAGPEARHAGAGRDDDAGAVGNRDTRSARPPAIDAVD